MKNSEATNYVRGMKPSSYVGLMNFIFLVPSIGWVISIILWFVGKKQSKYVNDQGRDFINWMISLLIYCAVLGFISSSLLIIIGFSDEEVQISNKLISGLAVLYAIICPIIGGIKALKRKPWYYPFTFPIL